MPQDLKTLIGSSVIALDGKIGTVRNFLFDDRSWTIRHLVVDVDAWLNNRNVAVAVSEVEQPDWEKAIINVRMTKREVRDNPGVNTENRASTQQALSSEESGGKMAFWMRTELAQKTPTGTEEVVYAKEGPHLHGILDISGFEVWAADGEIGRIEGFIVDENSWHLGYLDVMGGEWLDSGSALISTHWIRSISWDDCRLNLQFNKNEMLKPIL
jgi:uncharacterized protein YrrD